MKKIVLSIVVLLLSVNVLYAQLTAEQQKKQKQIRYALKNEILSLYDISFDDYKKHDMWSEITAAAVPIVPTIAEFSQSFSPGEYIDVKTGYADRYIFLYGSRRKVVVLDTETLKTATYYHSYDSNVTILPIAYKNYYVVITDKGIDFKDLSSNKVIKQVRIKYKHGSYRVIPYISEGYLYLLCSKNGSFRYGGATTLYVVGVDSLVLKRSVDLSTENVMKVQYPKYQAYSSSLISPVKKGYEKIDETYDVQYDQQGVTVKKNGDVLVAYSKGDTVFSDNSVDYLYLKKTNRLVIEGNRAVRVIDLNRAVKVSEQIASMRTKQAIFSNDLKTFSYAGDYDSKVVDKLLKISTLSSRKIKAAYAAQQLEKYSLRVRQSFKHGKIGERYVPYTSQSYTTYNYDYMTINGQAVNYSTNEDHTSSSGGYDENIYGYKAIFELKNKSTDHYLVEMQADWTGAYSSYITRSAGSWSDSKRGEYSELKTTTSASSYPQSFLLAPGEKYKYQFEVGEQEPTDLINMPMRVTVVTQQFYAGLIQSMDMANSDIGLISRYLNSPLVSEWHPQLKRNRERIIKERNDRFSQQNIGLVKVSLDYDHDDYDGEFDNPVTVVINAEKPLLVKYESPFATETVRVDQKASIFSGYEYRITQTVKGVSKDKLSATATYVWPLEPVVPKATSVNKNSDKTTAAMDKHSRGLVEETMDAAGYTYLFADKSWFAAPAFTVAVGDTVIVPMSGMVMKDYHSRVLDRTFAAMTFVSKIEVVSP